MPLVGSNPIGSSARREIVQFAAKSGILAGGRAMNSVSKNGMTRHSVLQFKKNPHHWTEVNIIAVQAKACKYLKLRIPCSASSTEIQIPEVESVEAKI
jgi:hypothetical protein